MPIKKRPTGKPTKPPECDDPAGVDALIAALEHPLQPLVEEVRGAILGADHAITEGVKWNSPSFYFAGWFATLNLRETRSILVVLHQGAKPRSGAPLRDSIEGGDAILHWHSVDRASVAFVLCRQAASIHPDRKAVGEGPGQVGAGRVALHSPPAPRHHE